MLPSHSTIHEGDFIELVEGWEPGWADLVCSGPSAYGEGRERRDRELAWLEGFKRALKPSGLLVTVWPLRDVWGLGKILCEAKWGMQAVHRVTVQGTYPSHSSQVVLVAKVFVDPEPVQPFDAHFHTFTRPSWSSSAGLEVIHRIVETYSEPGDVVFDPFMGMATTAIACEGLGREWVGCEIEPTRIPQAYERIERETNWRRPNAAH